MNQETAEHKQTQMPACLQEPLEITPLAQTSKGLGINRTPIPVDPECLPHLKEGVKPWGGRMALDPLRGT